MRRANPGCYVVRTAAFYAQPSSALAQENTLDSFVQPHHQFLLDIQDLSGGSLAHPSRQIASICCATLHRFLTSVAGSRINLAIQPHPANSSTNGTTALVHLCISARIDLDRRLKVSSCHRGAVEWKLISLPSSFFLPTTRRFQDVGHRHHQGPGRALYRAGKGHTRRSGTGG